MKTLYHVGVVETVPYDVAKDLAISLNGRYHSAIGAGKLKIANTGFMFVSKSDAQCFERMLWHKRADITEVYIRVFHGKKFTATSMNPNSISIDTGQLAESAGCDLVGNASISIQTIGGSMTWRVSVVSLDGNKLQITDKE